ncbi:MAG: 2OG-Fe(II) oxygenase [Deltaproteobacteria bacterium]|nr:MAG: 2OG-Fe(II) oxygenase [Deltaproteobacteria bacterium]
MRDGWEIGKRQIKIDARRWRRTLDPQLVQIGRDLGLPGGCAFRAELHNMLVYGPGQFFAPHQDSEKADGMIGTLVVALPSVFKGGALVIEHHDEKVSYRGSPERLSFVAFYADCHHEVRPVTHGYRVVLTYNLFLEGGTDVRRPVVGKPLEAMVRSVRAYFETPGPERQWRPPEGPPDRLVYLLDHQYTQKGLSWQALKNGDAARAALIRQVAAQLDCEVALALADVHESWSCEDDGQELVQRLVKSLWSSIEKEIRSLRAQPPSSTTIKALLAKNKPIVGLLATAVIAQDAGVQKSIVDELTTVKGHPLRCGVHLLRTTHAGGSSGKLHALGLDILHADCTRTLIRLLATPVRTANDWSIAMPLHCRCALCKKLASFLVAGDQRQLDWPLANDKRAHVHQTIDGHELPVTHQTRRTGRPYTLVLCKTKTLFAREATERKEWASDLAWLNNTARAFAPVPQRSSRRA